MHECPVLNSAKLVKKDQVEFRIKKLQKVA